MSNLFDETFFFSDIDNDYSLYYSRNSLLEKDSSYSYFSEHDSTNNFNISTTINNNIENNDIKVIEEEKKKEKGKEKEIKPFKKIRHFTHLKSASDNICRKAFNKVIKYSLIDINNNLKNVYKKLENMEAKKRRFCSKKEKEEFLNTSLKHFFAKNEYNIKIINYIENNFSELNKFLNMTFEQYFEIYDEKYLKDDIKVEKNEYDVNYIEKYRDFCRHPKDKIRNIKQRKKIKKRSNNLL